jgi:DNA-binding NarL/FixJ family response regulator
VPARKRSILIVDADAFLAGVYARRFESGRWSVRVADSAEEAEKLVGKKVPDAAILDPENVPGAEALMKRWEHSPKTAGIVLVVLTKVGDRASIDRAMAAGADGYFLKGHFVPSEVREKMERLVADAEAE